MSTNIDTAGRAKRQKTDDDSSTTAAEDDRKNASPTGKDISLALCRIVDTDKYTTDEINKSLDNLGTWGWGNNDTDERARTSKEFIDLGGIPRILNFIQENKDNIGFMFRASRVIDGFLFPGSNDEHLEHASTMAQKFVEREGVELMLSIVKEKYTGKLDIDQVFTLDHIFCVLGNTMWIMNKKNKVDIDKFLPIIDTGISTLAILSIINTHGTAVAFVKRKIFLFFRNFVHYNAEMIDAVDFHEKNIFQECVRALKNPINNTWKYDKKVWEQASWFFYTCCMGNRKILSRENDFEVIVPFCIQFMKLDPNHASASCAFGVLRKASNIIGKKKMMTSHKGLLDVLGTVVDCGNDTVSNDVKKKATTLSKYLYNGL